MATDTLIEPLEGLQEVIKPVAPVQISKEERKLFYETLGRSKKVFNTMMSSVNEQEIEGKSLKDWAEYFKMSVPANPSIGQVHSCMSRLSSLFDVCTTHLERSLYAKAVFKRELEDTRAKEFVRIKTRQGVINARSSGLTTDYIEAQLDYSTSNILNELMYAEYVVEFWEGRKQHLVSIRKILESMYFGLNSDVKLRGFNQTDLPKDKDWQLDDD